MSILIKGVKMPKSPVLFCIHPDGKVFADLEGDWREYKAVPVQPHGRLGDLDKLESGLRHMAKYQHGERQQGILGCCETIRLAPTIFPADVTGTCVGHK